MAPPQWCRLSLPIPSKHGRSRNRWTTWPASDVSHAVFFVDRDADGDELEPWFLSELLMDMGAMSVSVDDADLGTKDETPLLQDHTNSKVTCWVHRRM